MNQGYNNYNGYNQYNQGYNDYNQYNQGYNNQNQGNYNGRNSNNNDGGGIFSIIFALAALIALVYLLLTLLGYDVKGYIMKFINKEDTKTEENNEQEEKKEEVIKVKVKDVLKNYCKKIDSDGNYILEEYKDDEEFLDGNISRCENGVCMYARNTEEDVLKDDDSKDDSSESTTKEVVDYEDDVIYSYVCKSDIYTEMPKKEFLKDLRVVGSCEKAVTEGSYNKTYTDGTKMECDDISCKRTIDELGETFRCSDIIQVENN